MQHTKYLILGAGISGLAFAYEQRSDDYLILEKETVPGGLCRSFYAPGFVWDVAGHFFHFHSDQTKAFVKQMLDGVELCNVTKCAKVFYADRYLNAPFQYNIHQLPHDEFMQCLTDLYFANGLDDAPSFKSFVRQKFGAGISDKFLIPYNEKLYACDLDELERDSMGKFLPKLTFDMLMTFYHGQKGTTYNDFFLYPRQGTMQLVNSYLNHLDTSRIHLGEPVSAIDTDAKTVTTSKGTYSYDHLVSTIPLNRFIDFAHCGDSSLLHSNKIVVLNLGFDLPSRDKEVNWVYFPGDEIFYRVGFYNNIAPRPNLSLYVEIGCRSDEQVDIDRLIQQTLVDLKRVRITDDHQLISHHAIVVEPAYVHITGQSKAETQRVIDAMRQRDVHMVGRYARWEYSAIDDSIEQAQQLAQTLSPTSR